MGSVELPQLGSRRKRRNDANLVSTPRRYNYQDAKGVGLADLQYPLFAVRELHFQIKRIIGDYFFSLGWFNIVLGHVLTVRVVPIEHSYEPTRIFKCNYTVATLSRW